MRKKRQAFHRLIQVRRIKRKNHTRREMDAKTDRH